MVHCVNLTYLTYHISATKENSQTEFVQELSSTVYSFSSYAVDHDLFVYTVSLKEFNYFCL